MHLCSIILHRILHYYEEMSEKLANLSTPLIISTNSITFRGERVSPHTFNFSFFPTVLHNIMKTVARGALVFHVIVHHSMYCYYTVG